MIVEIMGLLIFFGIAILLFVRYQGDKGKKDVDSKELKVSIESLQKEMDKASTEAIERMGNHVNRFERLMKEAKAKDEDISYRIKEIRVLEDRLRKEIAESRALSEELKQERERTKDLRDELQRQAALTSQLINNSAQIETPMINVTSRKALNSYEDASVMPNVIDSPIIEEEIRPQGNFAALLTESIEKAEEDERRRFEPAREVYQPSKAAVELLNNDKTENEHIGLTKENASEIAKRMLRAKVPIEEVMRQTGMGRGAVELLVRIVGGR